VCLGLEPSGALPLNRLAQSMGMSPKRITYLVDRLEAAGYVERQQVVADRRVVLAAITKRGRVALAEATQALADVGFGLGVPEDGLPEVARLM